MKERGKDGSEDDKKYQYCPDGAQGLLLCPAEWIETLARGYRVLNKEFGLSAGSIVSCHYAYVILGSTTV